MEEVVTKVIQLDNAIELFQTMAIMSLNMGNLTMEGNSVKNIWLQGRRRRQCWKKNWIKRKKFQKGYKHNVEIWRKNRPQAKQKIKMFIKKLQDDNEELKGSTTWLNLLNEELQYLKQKVEIWETIERKWTKALNLHKKLQEALDSQMKALIKENENENVLTNLELVNLKNVSLLQFEEFRRKATKVRKGSC